MGCEPGYGLMALSMVVSGAREPRAAGVPPHADSRRAQSPRAPLRHPVSDTAITEIRSTPIG